VGARVGVEGGLGLDSGDAVATDNSIYAVGTDGPAQEMNKVTAIRTRNHKMRLMENPRMSCMHIFIYQHARASMIFVRVTAFL
jgi:hypothetical protein